MSNFVKPLKTSWMLSSTERELKLEETEIDCLQIHFLGFFGNFRKENKYLDITVLFSGVCEYKYFPDYSREDDERIEHYNWNNLPEFRGEDGGLEGHQEKFNKIWKKTGYCPNPSIYVVEDSDWIKSISLIEGHIYHYLILGGDYNLEVLAASTSAKINKKKVSRLEW